MSSNDFGEVVGKRPRVQRGEHPPHYVPQKVDRELEAVKNRLRSELEAPGCLAVTLSAEEVRRLLEELG